MRASGSKPAASRPEATITRSGAKRAIAGTTTRSIAARYAPQPEPAGSGMLTAVPTPSPSPFSVTWPESGGSQSSWCSEIVSTDGSA